MGPDTIEATLDLTSPSDGKPPIPWSAIRYPSLSDRQQPQLGHASSTVKSEPEQEKAETKRRSFEPPRYDRYSARSGRTLDVGGQLPRFNKRFGGLTIRKFDVELSKPLKPAELQTPDQRAENLDEVLGERTYRVSYATNRAANDTANPNAGFSGKRSSTTTYGNCDVFIPISHKIGSIGSSFLVRFFTRTDDRLQLTRISRLAEADLWKSFNSRLSSASGKHAVVFIHGYNVSFEEAAIRAAQIGADLGVSAMAMFSWPSQGEVKDYPSDESAIEASTGALTDFLVKFATMTEADAVHVIAHSMGNRGLLRAIERIFGNAERRAGIKFGQLILAAPDVDVDSFKEMATAYSELAARTTLYVSEKDRAVGLSRWLHGYPRVGFSPPVSIFSGIDTISVSGIDVSALGHGYVGEAREVLTDMHQLIFSGLPPEKRFSVRPTASALGEPYWLVGS